MVGAPKNENWVGALRNSTPCYPPVTPLNIATEKRLRSSIIVNIDGVPNTSLDYHYLPLLNVAMDLMKLNTLYVKFWYSIKTYYLLT